MFEDKFIHKTPSNSIEISIKAITLDSKDLKYFQDTERFEHLCKEGCVNYNNKWSCPPFSPSYETYSSKYKSVLLILLYCNLDQFFYTKTEYMKIKASNSILKSKSDKITRFLEDSLGGTMLSNGSCRLCKPCGIRRDTHKCLRPDKVRYSMEATGLNVNDICSEFFKHKLLWYKDKIAPEYSSVVSCLLTNRDSIDFDLNNLLQYAYTI